MMSRFKFVTRWPVACLIAISMCRVAAAQEASNSPPFRPRLPSVISPATMPLYVRASVLVLNSTRAELRLSDDQGRQVDEELVAWSESVNAAAQKRRENAAQPPSRERLGQELEGTAEHLRNIRETLTAEQNTRLEQLVLQRLEGRAFLMRDPAVQAIQLDENQFAQLRKIYQPAFRKTAPPDATLSKYEQFLALLTQEQRRQWSDMLGPEFYLPGTASNASRSIGMDLPGLGRDVSLLSQDEIRKGLALTEEQIGKIEAWKAPWDNRRDAGLEQYLAGPIGEGRKELSNTLSKDAQEVAAKILAVLTPEQEEQLRQLRSADRRR
jgi:hypothetical protein